MELMEEILLNWKSGTILKYIYKSVNKTLMAVIFQVEVFWVVKTCSFMVGGPCCLHLQGEALVSYLNTTQHHNPEDTEARGSSWYPTTTLHGVTTQTTST